MDEPQIATESAPAPAADSSAATSAEGVAASSDAAAPQSDVAASSHEGARQPSTLDELYEKYRNASEQAEGEPPAAPEPEQPKEEPNPEEAAPEEDPLAEFEQKPLTPEQINELWPRTPTAIREKFAAAEQQRATLLEERAELGGDAGVEFSKSVNAIVFKAEVGEEDAEAFMNHLSGASLPLVIQTGQHFINTALNDEQHGPAFGDKLLQGEFGEGYTAERIRELVELDRNGLLDDVRANMQFARTPTETERALREENAALKAQLSGSDKTAGKDATATTNASTEASAAVDELVTGRAMDVVLPIARKIGWAARDGEEATEEQTLRGEMLTAWLNQRMQASPEFREIQQLKARGDALREGLPSPALQTKLDRIEARAKALFLEAARKLNASRTPAPAKTPNAPKGGDAAPKTDTPPPPVQEPKPRQGEKPMTTRERLDALHRKYAGAAADAEVSVGRR